MSVADMPATAARPRPIRKRVVQSLRRAHLFVGLFMIPWVLVYAVTGFLLNHHAVWPDREVRAVTADHVHGTGLDRLPSAAELAADVTAAINARAGTGAYRLADPAGAKFDYDYVPLEAKGVGHEVRVNLDVLTRTGEAQLRPAGGPPPSPFDAAGGVFGAERLEDRLAAGAPALFERLGLPAGKAEVPWLPELTFRLTDAGGRAWAVRYDPKAGAVRGRPAESADPEKGLKQFLYTLHFTHGYPPSARLRTAWAVFVDLTAFALVFWCVTGLLMWWQIKAVRRAGVAVLAASVLTAALIGAAMYGAVGR